jgi:hypothetical protein
MEEKKQSKRRDNREKEVMRLLGISIWPPSIPDPKFLHVCLLSFVLSASPVTPVRSVGPRGHKARKDFPCYHFLLSILECEGNEKLYEYWELHNFIFYFNIYCSEIAVRVRLRISMECESFGRIEVRFFNF